MGNRIVLDPHPGYAEPHGEARRVDQRGESGITPRITLDYRQLNNLTYKDSYPLPNIADCLDAFKGAACFAVLDLRSSFYQVPLAEEDRDKTAFITRRGQWRFRSLPMGLCNSLGTFQRLMDAVLRGLIWVFALV